MPRGDKSKYTDKQKRKAEHIEEGYEARGVPEDEAERRAWATVNKESGGGNKSGSGRGVPDTHVSSKKGGKLGGLASASRPAEERSAAAKKAAATRKRRQPAKDKSCPLSHLDATFRNVLWFSMSYGEYHRPPRLSQSANVHRPSSRTQTT
jgi:plasmid stabilization system protein ParE